MKKQAGAMMQKKITADEVNKIIELLKQKKTSEKK